MARRRNFESTIWTQDKHDPAIKDSDSPYIVKKYYDEIDLEMAKLEKETGRATIGDAVVAMEAKGNLPFFKAWSDYLDVDIKGTPEFDESNREQRNGEMHHNLGHLCMGLAHTPEQEMLLIPFQTAFRYARESKEFIAEALEKDEKTARDILHIYYKKDYKTPELNCINPERPSLRGSHYKRNTAVYFAAGLYLHNKACALVQKVGKSGTYEAQQAFAIDYAKPEREATVSKTTDSIPTHFLSKKVLDESMPYALIKISPAEMSAITAVATGLCKPEETDYPERLAAVKATLVEDGLFYDVKDKLAQARADNTAAEWDSLTRKILHQREYKDNFTR